MKTKLTINEKDKILNEIHSFRELYAVKRKEFLNRKYTDFKQEKITEQELYNIKKCMTMDDPSFSWKVGICKDEKEANQVDANLGNRKTLYINTFYFVCNDSNAIENVYKELTERMNYKTDLQDNIQLKSINCLYIYKYKFPYKNDIVVI